MFTNKPWRFGARGFRGCVRGGTVKHSEINPSLQVRARKTIPSLYVIPNHPIVDGFDG